MSCGIEWLKEERWYWNLIVPLYRIFDKYLRDPKTKASILNQTDIFHYVSHLLIACDMEKADKTRGHMVVFDKIRQYSYRLKHIGTPLL
jgi:hypothetical protein